VPAASRSARAPANIAPMRHLVLGFMGSVIFFASACGGKVVVDAGGEGGSGGDMSSTGDVSPVGEVSSSSGGPGLCAQVCSKLEQSNCIMDPGCVGDCQQSYATAGPCASQLDDYVQCMLNATITVCNDPGVCETKAQAFTACMDPEGSCADLSCSGGSDGTCDCKASCGGHVLEAACTPGNATDFCTCIQDGVIVGKCTEQQPSATSCDVVKGCCASQLQP
jgi:hypothetical protein